MESLELLESLELANIRKEHSMEVQYAMEFQED